MCHVLSKIKAQSSRAIFVFCDLSSVFRFLYSSPLLTKWTHFKNKNDYWVTTFCGYLLPQIWQSCFVKFCFLNFGGNDILLWSCYLARGAQKLKICGLAKMNMATVRYVPWKLADRLKSFRKKNSPKIFRLGFGKLIGHLAQYIYFFYDKKIEVNILTKVFLHCNKVKLSYKVMSKNLII